MNNVTDFYTYVPPANVRPYQQVQDMFSLRVATYKITNAEGLWHVATGAERGGVARASGLVESPRRESNAKPTCVVACER